MSASAPKRVLFLDGLGCNPSGFKPTYLRGLGYEVAAPMLSDRDFPAAVRAGDDAMQSFGPDVVVGYSRGASVAMMLADRSAPRLLIAPALHWVAEGRPFRGRLVVLHSGTDDGLPLAGVVEQMARCGLPAGALRVVGDDHTMIDRAALSALEAALAELIAEAFP